MDINQGYSILKAVMLENGRGFALGEHPTAPEPFVTWACYDDEHGRRQYEWGHYGSDRAALEQDLSGRVWDYRRQFSVKVAWVEEPGLYKYYSTQRPVDIGTFPKPPHNAPDEIINYDQRVPVEGGAFLAWGHLTYTRPLSEKDMTNYELRPSRDNPDLRERMEQQAEVVGKWEDAKHIPDAKRLTWFYPDFGSYVVKEFVTPEQLAQRADSVERQRAAAEHKREKPPISQQMKEAGRQAQERQTPATPKKDAPDRGER